MTTFFPIAAAVALLIAPAIHAQDPMACDNLAKLALPNATITLAQSVAPGAFTQPAGGGGGGRGPAPSFTNLPAFCRVAATLKPTSDSDIKMEVWLPRTGWNGKFEVVGNGGWAGNIGYVNMGRALVDGYAAAGTDTGHTGGSASFAYGHPEKMLDFGWRAVHETTVKGKAIIQALYGNPTKLSYFNGCSTGGRQAMNAVQNFPEDFNGVIAGAPVNPMTRLHAGSLYNTIYAHKDEANYIPPSKYPMIHKAVLDACDALDSVKDGLIENPLACHFDPKVLECKGEDGPACLTAAQVGLAKAIYGGAVNPRTKEQIYPGWSPGSELGWRVTAGPEPEGPAVDTYRYVVFQDPNWDWHTLNFDGDIALSDKRGNATINAVETDLSPFFAHGGKLLMFHGWSDPNVAPRNTVNYYNQVADTMGGASKISGSVRLFMMPGMAHCGGGEGPNDFDKIAVIDQWVQTGKAPDSIVASHATDGKVDRTRPLCPFPQVAQYKGTGSIDDAANFTCAAPPK
ncbi:MAG: tannase/feruloyl esterase family alpha/beta hydrolase [Candidatus Solibacter sp.]|nr:tannase/feruloyl esterase family alpha/beta hydrolase [Candidatus Solibacter sp.]